MSDSQLTEILPSQHNHHFFDEAGCLTRIWERHEAGDSLFQFTEIIRKLSDQTFQNKRPEALIMALAIGTAVIKKTVDLEIAKAVADELANTVLPQLPFAETEQKAKKKYEEYVGIYENSLAIGEILRHLSKLLDKLSAVFPHDPELAQMTLAAFHSFQELLPEGARATLLDLIENAELEESSEAFKEYWDTLSQGEPSEAPIVLGIHIARLISHFKLEEAWAAYQLKDQCKKKQEMIKGVVKKELGKILQNPSHTILLRTRIALAGENPFSDLIAQLKSDETSYLGNTIEIPMQ